ncbi:MAG TPA: ADOP family duplicated permease [Vicinamibacterales bacterium]|nr:ADOP family duplicated permease [Vicinamibacterales bacterium]
MTEPVRRKPDVTCEARPPRVADWLLRHALPPGDAGDTIRGDLFEAWHDRAGSAAASRWYWRQTISLAARYAWRRPPSMHVAQPRERRRGMFLDNLKQDLRYALRSYAKAPSFTVVILTTLALGIGASTAIFSLVNGILLQPLPLPDPDRLVYATEIDGKGDAISVSWPNYLDWRARARSFQFLALSRDEPMTLTGSDRAQRLRAGRVTGNLFSALGVSPVIGRALTDDDDRPDAAPAAVLTDAFWRSQMSADPGILGHTLKLDGVSYTIVGVMPRSFEFPRFDFPRAHDLFVSMATMAASRNLVDRGNHNGFSALARLAPNVTLEVAASELQTIAAALEHEYPNTNAAVGVRTERLVDRVVDSVRLTLLVLFGAVGFLLLIACVNVANLLIARGAGRQHELAVRAALGGGRTRLAIQMLVESTLISALGGALGIVFAGWLVRALVAAAPQGTPRITDVHLDGTALLFAFAAAAVCGVVFGALPAFQASGVQGQHALVRGRSTGFAARSHRLRRGLMVVETALALVLLTGAGLMMRTLQELTHVDTGIRTDHLLTTRFTLAGEAWTLPRRLAFYDAIVARTRALPGVTHAALTLSLPIDGSQWNSIFTVADKPVPERAKLPSAAFTPVTTGFFETMGMRLMRGRLFNSTESPDSAKTLVINETLARKIWPGEDPIGKRLKQGWPETPDTFAPWREIVGVVSDVKFNGVTAVTPLQAYLPLVHDGARSLGLVIRTATEPSSVASAVEGIVRDLDKDVPLSQTRTMDQMLDTSFARERMSMVVFVVFAIVALTLASVGLYGVVSHGVTERTHEIGVRMALGAEQRHVLGLVVRQGLTTTVVGVAIGVAGAFSLSRWIEGLLFGVTPTDPKTMAAVVATLMSVSLVACYVPAWRATRVDPTMALRSE